MMLHVSTTQPNPIRFSGFFVLSTKSELRRVHREAGLSGTAECLSLRKGCLAMMLS